MTNRRTNDPGSLSMNIERAGSVNVTESLYDGGQRFARRDTMPMGQRLVAVAATAATVLAAMFFTSLAQVPQVPSPQQPTAAVLQNYQPVTAERLKNPEPGNWLMIRRTYDGWGYSPLNQITTRNVSELKPVWGLLTGENRVHEAAPLVNNGVMFISTRSE